jgi:hypothetical protein
MLNVKIYLTQMPFSQATECKQDWRENLTFIDKDEAPAGVHSFT